MLWASQATWGCRTAHALNPSRPWGFGFALSGRAILLKLAGSPKTPQKEVAFLGSLSKAVGLCMNKQKKMAEPKGQPT